MSEEFELVFFVVFDSKENVIFELLGYIDGKWIFERVYLWWNVFEFRVYYRILGYIIVFLGGIVEFFNSIIFKFVCKMVKF